MLLYFATNLPQHDMKKYQKLQNLQQENKQRHLQNTVFTLILEEFKRNQTVSSKLKEIISLSKMLKNPENTTFSGFSLYSICKFLQKKARVLKLSLIMKYKIIAIQLADLACCIAVFVKCKNIQTSDL